MFEFEYRGWYIEARCHGTGTKYSPRHYIGCAEHCDRPTIFTGKFTGKGAKQAAIIDAMLRVDSQEDSKAVPGHIPGA